MFEAMVGNFAYSGDIHLFINVINGALVLYCEDAVMLRFCMATYINAGHQFRNVFALNGYARNEFCFFCSFGSQGAMTSNCCRYWYGNILGIP